MQMIMTEMKMMTDKAYIVANEQQECKVIDKIKQSGVSPNGKIGRAHV